MKKALSMIALAAAALASPAQAADFRFDFTGTVLAETRPSLTVTPRPITGSIEYTAPTAGDFATTMGSANLSTSLYGSFFFSNYSVTRSDTLFTFSGFQTNGQNFSLRASALPNGGFGFVGGTDGFSLTGTPVNATGRLSGSFADTSLPEPGTWMMLVGGFGVLGATLRRRRVRFTTATA